MLRVRHHAAFVLLSALATAQVCSADEVVPVPTALRAPHEWRYTTEDPGEGFADVDFDDGGWLAGAAGFGATGTPGAVVGTEWTTEDIWLRTSFEYTPTPFDVAALHAHYDDEAVVYLNGQWVADLPSYAVDYELIDATQKLRAALVPGRNVLAVHAHQTYGGQFIDVGVTLDPTEEIPKNVSLPHMTPLFDYPVRDTSICLVDGVYYLTGTTGYPTWWETNEGIRVWKSTDLRTWKPLGLVWSFERDGTWQREFREGRRSLWAPELHHLKGTFWLTYSMNYGGTGVLRSVTGDARGPYVDIKPDGPLTGEIDASLFEDDDGAVYFVYQNGKIARMTDDMTGLAQEPTLLTPSGSPQVGFEGAFITRLNGRYYLLCADFIRGEYHCMVASADSLRGPYSERYLAVPHGGHNMLFRDAKGRLCSTFFGSDGRAPFSERPGILRVEFSASGEITPVPRYVLGTK